MLIRVLKLMLIYIYFIEAAELSCLPSALCADENTLRPMASALSGNMGVSSSVKTLQMSSPGYKKDSDIVRNGEGNAQQQDCGLRSFDVILGEYSIRNSMHITSDESGRKRRLQRLKYVIEKTKDIPDFLIEKFKDRKIKGIIVLGTYLWFEGASDIELLIITEGEDELEMLDKDFIPIKELLKDRKVALTGIECIAATVGYDRLKELKTLEIYSYAIRGWREGITIFGEDPYKSEELSSCPEKIQHLDFLLDSSEFSLSELENLKAASRYDERAARVASYHKDRIGERTTEAISMLKEIAGTYGMKEIIRSLEVTERKFKRREFHKPKEYYQQVRKVYERLIEELKAKPRSSKKEVAGSGTKAKKPAAEGGELSRAEKLNLILEKHPELDTADKLLAYIEKDDPHLLDAISEEKQLEFLRDFIFLRYETIPLPKQVLEQLTVPGMYAGKRIAIIREARRMQPKELLADIAEKIKQGIARSKWGIAYSTYSYIEKSGGLPRPGNLFDISRELKLDPIFIIDGTDWDGASCDLADHEKMHLCRLRKGWTLDKCALGLKSKLSTVEEWEKAKRVPNPEQRAVIRKVFADSSLYKKADEIEAAEAREAEARAAEEKGWKFLPGVSKTKIHLFLAQHPEVSGMTPSEIERDYGMPAVGMRLFLRKNKAAVDTYGIVLLEERKPPGRRPKAKPGPSAKEELPTLPAVTKAKKPKATKEKPEEEMEEAEPEEARLKRRLGKVIIEEAEADYAIYIGGDICDCLRTPGDRELVDGIDIEDAICDLEFICDKTKDLIEKEASPERQKEIIEQWGWIEAKDILQRLKSSVSTELCDWHSPEIGQKADEITKGLTDDSDRVKAVKKWAMDNIELVPEYDGCWDTKASETLSFSKGTYFNRVNLIIAMLRSIGIPAHYRIISFKKGTAETEEHILVEALITIEEHRNKITEDIYRKCRWIALEPIDAENIIESHVVENIDEYALEKAEESRSKPESSAKDRSGAKRADPSKQLRADKAIRQAA